MEGIVLPCSQTPGGASPAWAISLQDNYGQSSAEYVRALNPAGSGDFTVEIAAGSKAMRSPTRWRRFRAPGSS